MLEMNATPRLRRVKHGYTSGARSLASRSVTSLARTGITPNVLTATGVSLCLAAAILVPFEDHGKLLFFWLAAGTFVVGSRAERVVVITGGLVLAPTSIWLLVGAIALLTATAWITVLQRILFVRKQLRERP